jgi:hypothetical protein
MVHIEDPFTFNTTEDYFFE